MKKITKIIMTLVLPALILVTMPALSRAADESKQAEQTQTQENVSGEVAASVLSAYIWRGQELTRHSAVIQPSITAGCKGFAANVWGNLDTRPYSGGDGQYSSNFTETDVTLSYSRKFGIVQAGAGYIYYGLAAATPGGPDLPDAQEFFLTLGLDTILAPTLTVYKEIDHYHQWYATLGVSHTFALHEKMSLKMTAVASYLKSEDETTYPRFDGNSVATADKFNNFHDGVISISLPVALTKSITIIPTTSYVFALSDDAKYEMKARGLRGADPTDRDSSYLYGGLTLSYIF